MKLATTTAILLIALLAYLLAWPVAVEPHGWNAPVDAGLVEPFAPNDRLRSATPIKLVRHYGPENLAAGRDGLIYSGTVDGKIIRFGPTGYGLEVYSDVGGRPLGIEFDASGTLIVANAFVGLQAVARDGSVRLLLDAVDGQALSYVNDVAVSRDGRLFFTDSSSRFGAAAIGDTYEASLLDIVEHGGHGRLLEYDPAEGRARVLMKELNFANGVAVSTDQQYLLIAETGAYRIMKYWLEGPKAGTAEQLVRNLPGFPDNIDNGLQGRFWIGLVAPRNHLLDRLSDLPALRKVVMRLPKSLRPSAAPSSHVFAVDGDGQVLVDLQERNARFPQLTGVLETRDALFLSNLHGNRVPRLEKRALASQ